nr:hypothetical protein [uncultured Campylobacter sp.]
MFRLQKIPISKKYNFRNSALQNSGGEDRDAKNLSGENQDAKNAGAQNSDA